MPDVTIGKKTIVFKTVNADIQPMVDFFNDDTNSTRLGYYAWDMVAGDKLKEILYTYMQLPEYPIHLAQTKEGKGTRKVGYFWLTPITDYIANIEGLLNSYFVKGLDVEIKKGRYTFLEDAMAITIKKMFEDLQIQRIGCFMVDNKSPLLDLLKKVGFKKEGKLRKVINYEADKFADGLQFSILREEVL